MSDPTVTVSTITGKDQGGGRSGTAPASGGSDLSSILYSETFESFALGLDPDTIAGFSEVTASSVISDEQALSGTKSYKDVSITGSPPTGTEWANGFILDKFPTDLVEGDEAWIRMPVYIPAPPASDLEAPAEGGRLKWMRYRTETAGGSNQGYADIYYQEDIGEWRFIKEGVDLWQILATGAGGEFDMEYGKWVMWEFYIKFHNSAGVVRYWKDGVLVDEVTGLATLKDAADVVKLFYFRTYWNGGIPQQQDWYYDSIAMAIDGAGRTDSTHLTTDAAGNKLIGTTL